jgi:hypothetical protein
MKKVRRRTRNFSGLRLGCRHGLSDEEKKNTSDNLELHLELAD